MMDNATGITAATRAADLNLLHAVIAYARANGWTHDSTQLGNLELEHRWMRGGVKVGLWDSQVYVNGTWFTPASVRQAVDVLVALGVLPVEFSSAYEAGEERVTNLARANEEAHRSEIRQIIAGHRAEALAHLARHIFGGFGPGDIDDRFELTWRRVREALAAEPATEEPDRTLTAPERRAESDYIAQALDHIAAARPVVWTAAGGDDPNDEITGGAK